MRTRPWKHPHGRGEDDAFNFVNVRRMETPPRAWGRPPCSLAAFAMLGNTPTSVGKTQTLFDAHNLPEKHPHERGEDQLLFQVLVTITETPPRAWGRQHLFSVSVEPSGNTPTSVGKTHERRAAKEYRRKHPHERGEDRRPEPVCRCCSETPPRAWGRRRHRTGCRHRDGNTPTSVGKTRGYRRPAGLYRKHPHERGEDSVILLDFITQKIGSILVANELQAIQ